MTAQPPDSPPVPGHINLLPGNAIPPAGAGVSQHRFLAKQKNRHSANVAFFRADEPTSNRAEVSGFLDGHEYGHLLKGSRNRLWREDGIGKCSRSVAVATLRKCSGQALESAARIFVRRLPYRYHRASSKEDFCNTLAPVQDPH